MSETSFNPTISLSSKQDPSSTQLPSKGDITLSDSTKREVSLIPSQVYATSLNGNKELSHLNQSFRSSLKPSKEKSFLENTAVIIRIAVVAFFFFPTLGASLWLPLLATRIFDNHYNSQYNENSKSLEEKANALASIQTKMNGTEEVSSSELQKLKESYNTILTDLADSLIKLTCSEEPELQKTSLVYYIENELNTLKADKTVVESLKNDMRSLFSTLTNENKIVEETNASAMTQNVSENIADAETGSSKTDSEAKSGKSEKKVRYNQDNEIIPTPPTPPPIPKSILKKSEATSRNKIPEPPTPPPIKAAKVQPSEKTIQTEDRFKRVLTTRYNEALKEVRAELKNALDELVNLKKQSSALQREKPLNHRYSEFLLNTRWDRPVHQMSQEQFEQVVVNNQDELQNLINARENGLKEKALHDAIENASDDIRLLAASIKNKPAIAYEVVHQLITDFSKYQESKEQISDLLPQGRKGTELPKKVAQYVNSLNTNMAPVDILLYRRAHNLLKGEMGPNKVHQEQFKQIGEELKHYFSLEERAKRGLHKTSTYLTNLPAQALSQAKIGYNSAAQKAQSLWTGVKEYLFSPS